MSEDHRNCTLTEHGTTVGHRLQDEGRTNKEPLSEGDIVMMQNMTGPHPTRWMRTGVIIEKGYRQYYVKIDGSRRLLLRNRKNLKVIKPIQEKQPIKTKAVQTFKPINEYVPVKQGTAERMKTNTPAQKLAEDHDMGPETREEFEAAMKTPVQEPGARRDVMETPFTTQRETASTPRRSSSETSLGTAGPTPSTPATSRTPAPRRISPATPREESARSMED